jgi:hypothetical protein
LAPLVERAHHHITCFVGIVHHISPRLCVTACVPYLFDLMGCRDAVSWSCVWLHLGCWESRPTAESRGDCGPALAPALRCNSWRWSLLSHLS